MNENNFKEIIDFAIELEWEAVRFYEDLQTKVKSDASKLFLKEMENMERGHVEILKQFSTEIFENYAPEKVTNLKISEFMVAPPAHEKMTYQDVIVTAMKKEEAANKLYLALCEEVDDENIKNVFQRLADEESKHKFHLETLYDEVILIEN